MQLRPEKISNVWLVRDGIVNWFSETIWGRRRSEKNMTKKFLPCPTRFKLRGVSCRLSKLKRSRWELNLWTFAGSRRASIVFLRQNLQKFSSLDPCPINFFPIKRAFFRERIWFRSLLNENHENLILKHVWLPRFLPQKNLCSLIFTREKNVRRLSPKNESSSDRLVPSSFPVSFFFVFDFMTAKAHRRLGSCFWGSTNERVWYPCKVKMRMWPTPQRCSLDDHVSARHVSSLLRIKFIAAAVVDHRLFA